MCIRSMHQISLQLLFFSRCLQIIDRSSFTFVGDENITQKYIAPI